MSVIFEISFGSGLKLVFNMTDDEEPKSLIELRTSKEISKLTKSWMTDLFPK